MAIYRFAATVFSRSKGRSATAAAAYRSGTEIVDERTGVVHDYTRKRDIEHSEIITPAGAPAWMLDRQALWNGVEAAERRKDAQVAREVQLALPRELALDRQIALVRAFAGDAFVARGMVADLSVHSHTARDGGEQPHAHIMLAMRRIEGEAFGQKVREWNSSDLLVEWREQWAERVNEALAEAGVAARVDHRTLEAQHEEAAAQAAVEPEGERKHQLEARALETDREPSPYLRAAWYIEQKARHEAEASDRAYEPVTDRGQWYAAVKTIVEARLEQVRELVGQVVEQARGFAAKLFGEDRGEPQAMPQAPPRTPAKAAVENWRAARAQVAEPLSAAPTPQDQARDAVQRWRERPLEPESGVSIRTERPTPAARPRHDDDNSLG